MTAVDFLNFLMSDPELAPKELVISGRNKERKEVFAKFASTESNAKLLGNKDKMPVTLLEGTVNRCEGPNSFSTSTGALVEGVDGVIFATGYRLNFPFLDEKDDILQLRAVIVMDSIGVGEPDEVQPISGHVFAICFLP